MNKPIYKPIADGVYQHNGSVISVGSAHNQLSVSEKKRHMKIWVGELPDNWRLCEAVDLPAPDVPVEVREAMQLCAAAVKLAYFRKTLEHFSMDEVIAAEKLEKWLDAQRKKESDNA